MVSGGGGIIRSWVWLKLWKFRPRVQETLSSASSQLQLSSWTKNRRWDIRSENDKVSVETISHWILSADLHKSSYILRSAQKLWRASHFGYMIDVCKLFWLIEVSHSGFVTQSPQTRNYARNPPGAVKSSEDDINCLSFYCLYSFSSAGFLSGGLSSI